MTNETTPSQAYLEADKKHNELIHQAWLAYNATREAWNTCSPEDHLKHNELVTKAAYKMFAAKAARTRALNKILKAG
jgi:hypothetical protein